MNTITVSEEITDKLRDWIKNRGGILVWVNKDLGSTRIGQQTFTPATTVEGAPMGSPHWQFGNTAEFCVTDPACVLVEKTKEVKRVKVRQGRNGGVHNADRPKLDKAMAEAGESAFYQFDDKAADYPWYVAVVKVVTETQPMTV